LELTPSQEGKGKFFEKIDGKALRLDAMSQRCNCPAKKQEMDSLWNHLLRNGLFSFKRNSALGELGCPAGSLQAVLLSF